MAGTDDANFSDNFSELSYRKKKSCSCPKWLYDSRSGAVLGRTGRSWFLIFLFYVIFFACLAGFFMGMMLTFMYHIVPIDQPLRSGQHSLLKLSPGLGIRPSVDVQKTLIAYSQGSPESYMPLVTNIDAFLNAYTDLASKPDQNLAKCDNGKKTPEDVDKVCKFDLKNLGDCSKENLYGFNTKEPCVILKLNKIFGWMPTIKANSTVPHPLVKCTGQNPLDDENIGKMQYFPSADLAGESFGKFDSAFYPYVGQTSYVSPLVAVKFKSLKPNTVVLIQCNVYNIDTITPTDAVKFELLVD